jgi:hypothetical protein
MEKKAKDIFDFPWDVAQSGYQWIETTAVTSPPEEKRLFLSTGCPSGQSPSGVPYQPLKDSGLFLIFAALDPTTRESLLAFANTYGLLGEDEEILLPAYTTTRGTLSGRGEPYETWVKEIQAMRRAVELWNMLKSKNLSALRKVIQWVKVERVDNGKRVKKDAVRYQSRPFNKKTPHGEVESAWIATPENSPAGFSGFQVGKVTLPAWYRLQQVINRNLSGRVSPRLLWEESGEEEPPRALGLYFVPHTLIGALWLQFSLAVAQSREYRQCQYCGKPFILAPHLARTNRRNCSDSCKAMASRKRTEGKRGVLRRTIGKKTRKAA